MNYICSPSKTISNLHYAQVILPLHLKGSFTYKIPENLVDEVQVGMRVLVPFHGKKIYTGIVESLHQNTPEAFLPKDILNTLDEVPIVPENQLEFWRWLSGYYLCDLGDIYRFAFPGSLKLESETYLKLKPNKGIDMELLDANETYLIQALEVRQLINLSDIEAFIPKKDIVRTVHSLIDLQYIEIDEKINEKYKSKEISYLKVLDFEEVSKNIPQILVKLKRSPKQSDLLLLLVSKMVEHPEIPIRKSEVFSEGNFVQAHLKPLIDKGFVVEYQLKQDRLASYQGDLEEVETLSEIQIQAKLEIDRAFDEGKNVLLHGVTSSGKTHVYIEKISDCITQNKNVLYLLPEISLTKQIIQRLEKKYGKQLGFYHQKLTDFERVEVWRKIKNNELKILIGTRNSLFLPFQNLGLIIVDEEHDSAYRPREVVPYFNAKDAAQMLAHFYQARVILGSATPSVESYYAAQQGKLNYVELSERFGAVELPKYELIDFKEAQETKKNSGDFSFELIEKLKNNLDAKNQSMILHNRRGYSNVVECESCGYVTYCSNCDVVMTYHKFSNEMKCHYCGHRAAKPIVCPKCHSQNLNSKGVGVEKIFEEVKKIFPEAEVDRMDVDAMRAKFAYEKLYEKIENHETDIIVGTQMISKGLDFDSIEVIGVPRADQLIYIQDFRAEEKAYQLITQLAGRAGRVSGKGKVYLQTFHPQHPVFQLIKNNNSKEIYHYFLAERKKFLYPPFTKLIMIELKHRKEDKVNRAAQFMGSVLRKYLPEVCVFGPERSPIYRLNTFYQYQILLKLPKGKNYQKFKDFIKVSLEEFDEISGYKSIKKSIFVDF